MTISVLRIIDANCNRTREALRVLEDYARFVLADADLQTRLKQLRHDFQSATSALQSRAIAARDASSDVGTLSVTQTEASRESPGTVVTAAGKRLGEALRTVEEYLKIFDGANAANVERIRYRAYDIERDIQLTLTPGRTRMQHVRLYVLVTESMCKLPWLQATQRAIEGGATCLQLREKNLPDGELLIRARQFVELCKKHNVIAIINDRPDIALLSGADGVHVGQADLPARAVRQIIGPQMIIGVSTRAIEQAHQAMLDGADCIGVGPVFASVTKPQEILPGLEYAARVAREIAIPSFAISGIDASNINAVRASGVTGAAVSSSVMSADDPCEAARTMLRLLTQ